MKRRTITLPDDLDAAAEREARRLHTSASQIIREALEERLARKSGKRYAMQGIVSDGRAPQASDLEEYLEENWIRDLTSPTTR